MEAPARRSVLLGLGSAMAAGLGLTVTYGFYAVSAFVSYFLVQAWIRETRGRELEDMTG